MKFNNLINQLTQRSYHLIFKDKNTIRELDREIIRVILRKIKQMHLKVMSEAQR